MEHSVKASATYKPKRCIGPAKKRNKQPIMNKPKQIGPRKATKKNKFDVYNSRQPSKLICKDDVKNKDIQQKRTAKDKAYLCEKLVKKRRDQNLCLLRNENLKKVSHQSSD